MINYYFLVMWSTGIRFQTTFCRFDTQGFGDSFYHLAVKPRFLYTSPWVSGPSTRGFHGTDIQFLQEPNNCSQVREEQIKTPKGAHPQKREPLCIETMSNRGVTLEAYHSLLDISQCTLLVWVLPQGYLLLSRVEDQGQCPSEAHFCPHLPKSQI